MAKKTGQSLRAQVRQEAIAGIPARKTMGRPRTTVKDLPKRWKRIMTAEASCGGGVTAIMVKLGITHFALNTLLEDDEDFYNTYSECLLLSKLWWEEQGRLMTAGQNRHGSAPVWFANMQNRFDWRAKNEVSGDPDRPLQTLNRTVTMTKEEVQAALAERGLPTTLLKD